MIGPESALRELDEAMTEPISVNDATRPIREVVNIGVADPSVRLRTPQTAEVTVQIVPGVSTRTFTLEVTEHDPPNRLAFRGIDGPVRPQGRITFEPLDGGQRTRYSAELDFEGHGLGKLLVPLVVRRQAEKEMPANLRNLKQRLEGGA